MSHNQKFDICFFVWSVLGVVCYFMFRFNRNHAFKRLWYPPFTIALGLLFLAMMGWMSTSLKGLWLFAPIVGVISYLNIRQT